MKLTLDFDNNTVTSEQGTISVPGLPEKKSDILNILELTEIPMEELKEDIRNMCEEIGIPNIID